MHSVNNSEYEHSADNNETRGETMGWDERYKQFVDNKQKTSGTKWDARYAAFQKTTPQYSTVSLYDPTTKPKTKYTNADFIAMPTKWNYKWTETYDNTDSTEGLRQMRNLPPASVIATYDFKDSEDKKRFLAGMPSKKYESNVNTKQAVGDAQSYIKLKQKAATNNNYDQPFMPTSLQALQYSKELRDAYATTLSKMPSDERAYREAQGTMPKPPKSLDYNLPTSMSWDSIATNPNNTVQKDAQAYIKELQRNVDEVAKIQATRDKRSGWDKFRAGIAGEKAPVVKATIMPDSLKALTFYNEQMDDYNKTITAMDANERAYREKQGTMPKPPKSLGTTLPAGLSWDELGALVPSTPIKPTVLTTSTPSIVPTRNGDNSGGGAFAASTVTPTVTRNGIRVPSVHDVPITYPGMKSAAYINKANGTNSGGGVIEDPNAKPKFNPSTLLFNKPGLDALYNVLPKPTPTPAGPEMLYNIQNKPVALTPFGTNKDSSVLKQVGEALLGDTKLRDEANQQFARQPGKTPAEIKAAYQTAGAARAPVLSFTDAIANMVRRPLGLETRTAEQRINDGVNSFKVANTWMENRATELNKLKTTNNVDEYNVGIKDYNTKLAVLQQNQKNLTSEIDQYIEPNTAEKVLNVIGGMAGEVTKLVTMSAALKAITPATITPLASWATGSEHANLISAAQKAVSAGSLGYMSGASGEYGQGGNLKDSMQKGLETAILFSVMGPLQDSIKSVGNTAVKKLAWSVNKGIQSNSDQAALQAIDNHMRTLVTTGKLGTAAQEVARYTDLPILNNAAKYGLTFANAASSFVAGSTSYAGASLAMRPFQPPGQKTDVSEIAKSSIAMGVYALLGDIGRGEISPDKVMQKFATMGKSVVTFTQKAELTPQQNQAETKRITQGYDKLQDGLWVKTDDKGNLNVVVEGVRNKGQIVPKWLAATDNTQPIGLYEARTGNMTTPKSNGLTNIEYRRLIDSGYKPTNIPGLLTTVDANGKMQVKFAPMVGRKSVGTITQFKPTGERGTVYDNFISGKLKGLMLSNIFGGKTNMEIQGESAKIASQSQPAIIQQADSTLYRSTQDMPEYGIKKGDALKIVGSHSGIVEQKDGSHITEAPSIRVETITRGEVSVPLSVLGAAIYNTDKLPDIKVGVLKQRDQVSQKKIVDNTLLAVDELVNTTMPGVQQNVKAHIISQVIDAINSPNTAQDLSVKDIYASVITNIFSDNKLESGSDIVNAIDYAQERLSQLESTETGLSSNNVQYERGKTVNNVTTPEKITGVDQTTQGARKLTGAEQTEKELLINALKNNDTMAIIEKYATQSNSKVTLRGLGPVEVLSSDEKHLVVRKADGKEISVLKPAFMAGVEGIQTTSSIAMPSTQTVGINTAMPSPMSTSPVEQPIPTGIQTPGQNTENVAPDTIPMENGQPLLNKEPKIVDLFHGGNIDPVNYDMTKASTEAELGQGFYAGVKSYADEWAKERNGNVYPVKIDTKNFFDEYNTDNSDPRYQKVKDLLVESGLNKEYVNNNFGGGGTFTYLANSLGKRSGAKDTMFSGSDQMAEIIKKAGFDGAISEFRDVKQYVSYSKDNIVQSPVATQPSNQAQQPQAIPVVDTAQSTTENKNVIDTPKSGIIESKISDTPVFQTLTSREKTVIQDLEAENLNVLDSMNNDMNDYKKEYESLIEEQIEYLKSSGHQGVTQGSLNRREEYGEVVGRTGRVSKNPQWYRDYYAEHKKGPTSKADYRELAIKHLREGFADTTMEVPASAEFIGTEKIINEREALRQKLTTSAESSNVTESKTDVGKTEDVRREDRIGQTESEQLSSRTDRHAKQTGKPTNAGRTEQPNAGHANKLSSEQERRASGEADARNSNEVDNESGKQTEDNRARTGSDVRQNAEAAFRRSIGTVSKQNNQRITAKLINNLTETQASILKRLKSAIGIDAFFYDSDSTFGEGGFTDRDFVFIRTGTGIDTTWVYGHEMIHAMQKQAPDIAAKVNDAVGDISLKQLRQYVGILKGDDAYKAKMFADVVGTKEEMIGDMFANIMSGYNEETFLTPAQQNTITRIYDNIIAEFKGRAKTDYNLKDANFTARDLDKNSIQDLLLEYHNDDYQNNKEALQLAEKALQLTWKLEKDIVKKTNGQLQWDIGKNNYYIPSERRAVDRSGGIKTLGIGITSSFIARGRIDLRGFTARNAYDVAVHAQVYRDPRFETLRIIYMKGDTIVGHEGLTSRIPNTAYAFEHYAVSEDFKTQRDYDLAMAKEKSDYFSSIRNRMTRLKADGFYMVHNHPSGDPTPSKADGNATYSYMQELGSSSFRGHVIINSGKFHVIEQDKTNGALQGHDGIINLSQGKDELLSPSMDHPLLGTKISNSTETANLIKGIQVEDKRIVVFYMSGNNTVRVIQDVPVGLFNSEKAATQYLRGRGVEFGGANFIISVASKDFNPVLEKTLRSMIDNDKLLDVGITDEAGRTTTLRDRSPADNNGDKWMDRTGLGIRVNENQSQAMDSKEGVLFTARDLQFKNDTERNQVFDDLKKAYKSTDNFAAAGYLLPDGTLLDFGKDKPFGTGGWKDHADVHQYIDVEYTGGKKLVHDQDYRNLMVTNGAIRITNYINASVSNYPSLEIGMPITPEQVTALEKIPEKYIPMGIILINPNELTRALFSGLYSKGEMNRLAGDVEQKLDPFNVKLFDSLTSKLQTLWDESWENDSTENDNKIAETQKQLDRITSRGQVAFTARDVVPAFYPKLTKTIEDKMPKQAYAPAILGLIRSAQIKAEEVKWSGIEDWLKGQEGKVSKDSVTEFLRMNEIQIEEVTHTENTKFESYTLPGGENYRELLFTLPEKYNNVSVKTLKTFSDTLRKVTMFIDGNELHTFNTEKTDEQLKKEYSTPKDTYHSPHWNEKNVLAHTRLNDRVDAEGNKVLFIEEVQSDLHQTGKKKGYKDTEGLKKMPDGYTVEWSLDFWNFMSPAGTLMGQVSKQYLQKEYGNSNMTTAIEYFAVKHNKGPLSDMIPDAPFQKTWHEFVLKRLIRYAAENDYDQLAWTTGEQQADRYDLSKQVSDIVYNEDNKILVAHGLNGEQAISKQINDPSELPDIIGKEATKKIMDLTPNDGGARILDGLNLKVGGSGMSGFYDRMIPEFLNKYGKKWGAKVEKTDVNTDVITPDLEWKPAKYLYKGWADAMEARFTNKHGKENYVALLMKTDESWTAENDFGTTIIADVTEKKAEQAAIEYVKDNSVNKGYLATQPYFPITDAMKESVLYEGQPLFTAREIVDTPEFKKWFGDSKVVDSDGNPLIVYHGSKVKGITSFDKTLFGSNEGSGSGDGFYFTKYKFDAEDYGDNITSAYLSLQNPFDSSKDTLIDHAESLMNKYDKWKSPTHLGYVKGKLNSVTGSLDYIKYIAGLHKLTSGDIYAELGYDGYKDGPVYVAFEPNQIKSATGNTGKFSPINDDIRYTARELTATPEFKRWFRDSKVADEDGVPLIVHHGTDQEFSEFKGLAWFTNNINKAQEYSKVITPNTKTRKPHVKEVYLSIQKPKYINFWIVQSDAEKYMNTEKYDGVIVKNVGGSDNTFYIVKNSNQIKSAVNNNGEFSPEMPDINKTARDMTQKDTFVFSRPDTAAPTTLNSLMKNVGKPNANLVTRSEIERFVSERLDIPVAQGKFRQHALGVFKPNGVIRLKKTKDLVTLFHEVGHALDQWLNLHNGNEGFKNELMDLGAATSRATYSDEKVMQEGVAQFTMFYVTDNAQAKERAPEFYKFFESKTEDESNIKSLLKASLEAVKDYNGQTPQQHILGNVSLKEQKPPLKERLDPHKLYTTMFDQLHPLYLAVQKITGGEGITAAMNPFMRAWAFRGVAGKADAILKYGPLDNNNKNMGRGFQEIIQPIAHEMDDFRTYILAKHGQELEAKGKTTGFEKGDIESELARLNSAKYEPILKELAQFQHNVLHQLVDSGVMSEESFKTITESYEYYIPFQRVMDSTKGGGTGKGFQAKNPVHGIKGSTRNIIDPLQSIIANTFIVTNMADRNRIGSSLVELADQYDWSGRILDKVPPRMMGQQFAISEIEKVLKDAGVDTKNIDMDTLATTFRPTGYGPQDKVITVFKEGKPTYYEVFDDDLYTMFAGMDKETTNIVIKILSIPTKILRAGATGLNPDFIGRNIIKDTIFAGLSSKYNFIPFVDSLKGLAHVLKQDDMYQKWLYSGGANSEMISVDRDAMKNSLQKLLTMSAKDKTMNIIRNPIELIRAWSSFAEDATRVGVFAKGFKKESDKAGNISTSGLMEAGVASRETTVDFGRFGTVTKNINKTIAFFNAALQGGDTIVRAARRDKGKFLMRSLLYLTIPAIVFFLLNHDDPEYQEMPQYKKDLFWMFKAGGVWYSIPKPFELGMMFATLPERFLSYVLDNDPKAFDGWAVQFKDVLLPNVIFTAMLPALESMFNFDSFRGIPIVPMSERYSKPANQFGPYTSTFAKSVGKLLNVSPRQVDHLIGGYAAGVGTSLAQIAGAGLEATGLAPKAVSPDASWQTKVPILKGISAEPYRNSKSVNDFYNALNAMETEYQQAKDEKNIELGQFSKASELRKLRKTSDKLADTRRAYNDTYSNNKISSDVKRQQLSKLNMLMINFSRQALGKPMIKE